MKDVGGVAEKRSRTDGSTDGITHTRMDDGHVYIPPSPTTGNKKWKKNEFSNCVDPYMKRLIRVF